MSAEATRIIRDAVAQIDGLRCNAEGMLTWESAAKVAAAALVAYPACVPAEHSAATRDGALTEVEQLLHTRWRSAWDEWSKLVPKDEGEEPSTLCRRAWTRMEQALEDYEAVAALREAEARS